jgi:hypothetical protein
MVRGMLTGLLIGGVVGSAAAMIFAPKSGRELRRDITNKSRSLIGMGNDGVDPVFPGESNLEENTSLNGPGDGTGTKGQDDLQRI